MALDIRHDAAARRFLTEADGVQCLLEYRYADGVMTITHTLVPPEVGGRGIAGGLVRHAFEFARGQGWKVAPVCSYSAVWSLRHPEYADIVV